MKALVSWAPAGVLALGVVLVQGASEQKRVPLRAPLDTAVPVRIAAYEGRDVEISEAERDVAGMTSYVMRRYADADGLAFTLYVGYYDSQTQGRTIHSPKNCLPGGGWEALASSSALVPTPAGDARVNRYLLRRGDDDALVLYWYQGRGRVAHDEYAVKWDLLRDAALHGRSEEALVRIMVPVTGTEQEALDLAVRVAATVMPSLDRVLPAA